MDDKGGDFVNTSSSLIEPTLTTIKSSNANYVAYDCYWGYKSITPLPEIDEVNFTATENSIKEFAKETHLAGLKFSLWLELLFDDVGGWESPPYEFLWSSHSDAWWNTWFLEYEEFVIKMAKIAEEADIEMFIFVKQQDYAIGGPNANITNSYWRNLINKIRDVYSGKIGITTWAGGSPEQINITIDKIDFDHLLDLIILQYSPELTIEKDPNIQHLELKLNNWFSSFNSIIDTISCDLQMFTNFNSADGQNGYIWFEPSTDQPNIELDLLEQAEYYQALFNVLENDNKITGLWSWGYCWEDYFTTTGYRLAPSIRLKPAYEVIRNSYGNNELSFEDIIEDWNSAHVKLSGNISDIENNLVSGAVVTVSKEFDLPDYRGNKYYTLDYAYSDSTGSFKVSNKSIKTLDQGFYRVSVIKPRFRTYNINNYELKEDVLQNFSLRKLSIPHQIENVKINMWRVVKIDVLNIYDEIYNVLSTELIEDDQNIWSYTTELEEGTYYYNYEINGEILIEDINSDDFYVTPRFGGKKYSSFILESPTLRTFQFNPQDSIYIKCNEVIHTIPKNNAKDVGLDRIIELKFLEEIDSSNSVYEHISIRDSLNNNLDYELTYDSSKVLLKPLENFKTNTTYEVIVDNQISSVLGNTLNYYYTIAFKTGETLVRKIIFDETHEQYNSLDWSRAYQIENEPREYNKSYFGKFKEEAEYYYIIQRNTENELTTDFLMSSDILFLATPRSSFNSEEVANIVNFVQEGGNLIVLTQFTPFDSINNLLQNFGVSILRGYVNSLITGTWFDILNPLVKHPILEGIEKIHFNYGATLASDDTSNVILYSPTNCWRDINGNGVKDITETSGKQPILVAQEHGKGKVIVYTNNSFGDGWSFWFTNGTLLMNMLSWFDNNPNIITDIYDSEEQSIDKEFSLSQNYPNPFNPSTIIEYSIPKTTNVKLEVYNILGEKISTLVNEVKIPGVYKVVYSSNLSSGVYFVRMITDEYSKINKMLLLK